MFKDPNSRQECLQEGYNWSSFFGIRNGKRILFLISSIIFKSIPRFCRTAVKTISLSQRSGGKIYKASPRVATTCTTLRCEMIGIGSFEIKNQRYTFFIMLVLCVLCSLPIGIHINANMYLTYRLSSIPHTSSKELFVELRSGTFNKKSLSRCIPAGAKASVQGLLAIAARRKSGSFSSSSAQKMSNQLQ